MRNRASACSSHSRCWHRSKRPLRWTWSGLTCDGSGDESALCRCLGRHLSDPFPSMETTRLEEPCRLAWLAHGKLQTCARRFIISSSHHERAAPNRGRDHTPTRASSPLMRHASVRGARPFWNRATVSISNSYIGGILGNERATVESDPVERSDRWRERVFQRLAFVAFD